MVILTLWKLIVVIATVELAVATKTPNENIKPSLKESPPLFAPDFTSRPLRVLAVLPFVGRSHYIMSQTLMLEMAKRGHQITMVSPFPLKTPVANFTQIDISQKQEHAGFTFEQLAGEYDDQQIYDVFQALAMIYGPNTCRYVFNHPKVKKLLSGQEQFDVLFTEIFGTDCFLAVGYKLQIPTISVVTTHSITWMNEYVGDFDNPSFVENPFLKLTPQGLSSFVERLKNAFCYLMVKFSNEVALTRPSEEVVREFFGNDVPSLKELRTNVSLVMVNTHPSLFPVKPTAPRILPVGGLHLTPPQPEKISKDIQDWLESAPNGVVLFSMGTVVESSSIPKGFLKAFIEAFKEHKSLRFLWKSDATEAEAKAAGVPDNVKLAKWLPQLEILSHPNVVAFITHGGLMGTTEAIYYGVPMVGVPVFADQWINIRRYEQLGNAVLVNHNVLTKDLVSNAIRKVTSDPSVRQKAKEVSHLFRDRPQSPLDSAIWWTEYVVRHRGAHHLESPTVKIPFWQYALLDVAAAVLGALLALLLVITLIVRFLRRLLTRTKPTTKTKKQKKKD